MAHTAGSKVELDHAWCYVLACIADLSISPSATESAISKIQDTPCNSEVNAMGWCQGRGINGAQKVYISLQERREMMHMVYIMDVTRKER